jgi:lipase chaperone LimK
MNKRQSVYLLGALLVTATALIQTVNFNSTNSALDTEVDIRMTDSNEPSVFEVSSSVVNSLPSSLANTHHGVTLRAHNNTLIITASLKDLFDYYLSAAGEESLGQISQRVETELSQQLSGGALDQVQAVWFNYLAYKKELVDFEQHYPANPEEKSKLKQLQFLQQRQLALIALQDQVLTADVAEILFSFDRKMDGLTLERAELLASDLTEEQKQQALINIQAQLPISALQGVQRNKTQQTLVEIDQDDSLNEQEKFHLRLQQVGAAAANRLQELDQKRQRWQARILQFKQQKEQLRNSALASEEYEQSLAKLYGQHFTPEEQLRARALTSSDE